MSEIKVPTSLSGVICKLKGVSFCMDGATHIMHTKAGSMRLKASTKETRKQLDFIADCKTRVAIMGYFNQGPECCHIDVYDVAREIQNTGGPFRYSSEPQYKVIALIGNSAHCLIKGANEYIPFIFTTVFGPDTKEACEQYYKQHCQAPDCVDN